MGIERDIEERMVETTVLVWRSWHTRLRRQATHPGLFRAARRPSRQESPEWTLLISFTVTPSQGRRVGGALSSHGHPSSQLQAPICLVLISSTIHMGTLMWLYCQLDSPGQDPQSPANQCQC